MPPLLDRRCDAGDAMPPSDEPRPIIYATKRCPYCLAKMSVHATECPGCNATVGKINEHGMATKPFDWKGYIVCLLAWVGFGVYLWWAFF